MQWLTCTCLVDDLEAVLEVLADIVMRPVFPEQEVRTRRGEIETLIRQDADNPAVAAVEGLLADLYGSGHGYGRPPRGTVESVEAIDRAALQRFHAARFAPAALSLVMVGDIEPVRAIEAAGAVFGPWRASAPAPVQLEEGPRVSDRRVRVIPMMNKSQADVAYGFTSIRRSDPGYYAYWLMNNILGQYSIGGRLGDRIRERQGMAYYVFSALDANLIPGPLTIRAGVSPANVDRAIASIDEELTRMAADGPSDSEMAESKQYLIGSMPRTLETNTGIATFLQTAEFFGLGLDYDVRVPDLLMAVTRDEVHDAAAPHAGSRQCDGGHRRPVCGRRRMRDVPVRAVFFDVDFTLIYPGPTFQGEGYAVFCQRHGIDIDPARFADAVLAASSTLDDDCDYVYSSRLFVRYTRRIIEGMGGAGERLEACAEEIYEEWASCHHFFLYDDVAPVLRELAARGFKIGLISNSHRCLASFRAATSTFTASFPLRSPRPTTGT